MFVPDCSVVSSWIAPRNASETRPTSLARWDGRIDRRGIRCSRESMTRALAMDTPGDTAMPFRISIPTP